MDFYALFEQSRSRDSYDSGLTIEESVFDFLQGKEIFFISFTASRQGLRHIQPPTQRVLGALSSRI
jgi:hypothetical protein